MLCRVQVPREAYGIFHIFTVSKDLLPYIQILLNSVVVYGIVFRNPRYHETELNSTFDLKMKRYLFYDKTHNRAINIYYDGNNESR